MPPGYVKSISEEIFYEYAKLISRSAFDRKLDYGFITNKFKALVSGEITMSGTIRDWQREQELPKVCVFCGASENLQADHLIPKKRGGADSSDNMVLSCPACNCSRGDRGVFEWLGLDAKENLHRLVAGKYLKELHALHEAKGTLGVVKKDIPEKLCPSCKNGKACEEWNKVGKLTCFCLESVF